MAWGKTLWLTRLESVKSKLTNVSGNTHDPILSTLITQASAFVIKQTMRKLKPYELTEDYDGGTHTIVLNEYPVITVQAVYVDPLRNFGSDTQLSSDYYVWYRDGRLALRDLGSIFAKGHRIVRVQYRAGYSSHIIVDSEFAIELSDGVQHTASITPGDYDIWSLCSTVETALNELDIGVFSVTFDDKSQRVTVAANADFKPVVGAEVWNELGFTNDVSYAAQHSSDAAIIGVPHDLRQAVEELVIFKYEAIGTGKIGYRSESRGDQSLQFDFTTIPMDIREIIDSYTRRRIA